VKFSHLFVIGFNKTATTAIHKLFERSGIPSLHWDGGKLTERMVRNLLKNRRVLAGYDQRYRVFSDLTLRRSAFWIEGNQFFPQMARDYPNAGFLYNHRNIEDWVESRLGHLGRRPTTKSLLDFHLDDLGFSSEQAVVDYWKKQRVLFEERVNDFFKNSKHCYLSLDINSNEFVDDLSRFVDFPLKRENWTRANTTKKKR
jgi:hypothetical protein